MTYVSRLNFGSPLQPTHVFRGQSDSAWPLLPSLIRPLVQIHPVKVLQIEDAAVERFWSQAHLHLSAPVIEAAGSIVSRWVLMQHYRAPTRLLDWTVSPFVACYFAVEADSRCDGAIWIVNASALHDAIEKRYGSGRASIPDDPKELSRRFRNPNAPLGGLYVIRQTTETDRMVAQQTVCTVSEYVSAHHERILGEILSGEDFQKLVIPPGAKRRWLFQLQKMNISARTLFPGADGLGRSVWELVQLAAHHYSPEVGTNKKP